jgi:hypothetical protein
MTLSCRFFEFPSRRESGTFVPTSRYIGWAAFCAPFSGAWAMGKTAILGVVLIVLGIGGLLLGHFSYTETKPVVKAGPLQIDSEEQHNISIPTIGSIVLLLAGAGLVIAGRKSA